MFSVVKGATVTHYVETEDGAPMNDRALCGAKIGDRLGRLPWRPPGTKVTCHRCTKQHLETVFARIEEGRHDRASQ